MNNFLWRAILKLNKITYNKIGWVPGVLDKEPIFIYTMRKVGSSSIMRTLKALGYNLYKSHYLNPELQNIISKFYKDHQSDIPNYLKKDIVLTEILKKRFKKGKKCKVITVD